MPVVPVKPVSTELTNVTATPEQSSIGNLGQALGGAADKISPIALDMQMRKNADFVMQAETMLRDAEREHRKLVEERKGKDAYGVYEESESWWAETKQKISNDLENNAQRKMFHEVAENRRHVSLDTISKYEALEVRKSHYESAIAQIENAKVDAWEQPYNSKVIDEERKRIVGTFADIAASEGWKKDKTDFEIREALNEFHMGIVSKRLVDSPLAAELYYKQNKKEIFDEDNKLKALVKARVIEHKAEGLAEKYYAGTHSIGDARKKARDIDDKDLRSATQSAITARYAEDTQAKVESEARFGDIVRRMLVADNNLRKQDIDVSTWQGMSGADQMALSSYITARDRAKIDEVKADDFTMLRKAEEGLRTNQIRTPEDLHFFTPFLKSTTLERLRKAARMNETVDRDQLLTSYETVTNKKQKDWGRFGGEWDQWQRAQDYVYSRVKAGAQGTDTDVLIREFMFADATSPDNNFFWFDPDTPDEYLKDDNANFLLVAPKSHRDALTEVANIRGIKDVNEFYTKDGRDVILSLRKQSLPITPANILYAMDAMGKL